MSRETKEWKYAKGRLGMPFFVVPAVWAFFSAFISLSTLSLGAEKAAQAVTAPAAGQLAQQAAPAPTPAPVEPAGAPIPQPSDLDAGDDSGEIPVPKPNPKGAKGAATVESGRDLVNMDFPQLTDIRDIIQAVSLWTGKNVILDRNVTGKIQIISPKKVSKEEAYQAFLSALNMLNLTTVETGKVIKIMKVRQAVKGNLETYLGSSWAPRTDKIITQIVRLKYIDAKQIVSTLGRIVTSSAMIAYEPTNTLLISDSGYKVRRVLDILELLDVETEQPKVLRVPIRYSDPQTVSKQVTEILKSSGGGMKTSPSAYNTFKIMVDERSNSVFIFGPPRTIADIKGLVKQFDIRLDDPSTQATIHVRPLDYADAKKLATTLSTLSSGGKDSLHRRISPPIGSGAPGAAGAAPSVADLGDGVKITSDDATNSLLITGSRSAYEALNSIIRKLDVRRSQVFVEAEIMDLNQGNDLKFGTSIFYGGKGAPLTAWQAGDGMSALVVAQATAAAGTAASLPAVQGVAQALGSDLSVGVLGASSFDVPGIGKISPGVLIDMIKTDTNTQLLSSPHILTSNNAEASISVGSKIFLQSQQQAPGSLTVISKPEPQDIDLTLTLKPNVSYSDYVTLDLTLEQKSIKALASVGGNPEINQRKTKQLVTVKNGQTIVLSGLLTNQEFESYKKIPLLGDIPILGWLFRNTTNKKIRSNLVIFITPHIVHGAADLAAIYKKKLDEREEYFSKVYGSGYKKDDFYKDLPTYESGVYNPSEIDKAEEKLIDDNRQSTLRAIGLAPEEDLPKVNQEMLQESEINVPHVNIDDGSGGAFRADPGAGGGGAGGGGVDAGDREVRDLPPPGDSPPTPDPNNENPDQQ